MVERIYAEMTARRAEHASQRKERFPGTGIGTHLPRVSANLIAGLIEAIAAPPYEARPTCPISPRFAIGDRRTVPGRRGRCRCCAWPRSKAAPSS
ncbi:MAG: hypothetical protein WDN03_11845 [Rhizomicrobium sp.]